MDSSHASARSRRAPEHRECRLAWRPSSGLFVCLCALALAAIVSPWWSNLPSSACSGLDAIVVVYAAWRLWREHARAPFTLTWDSAQACWQVEGTSGSHRLRHVDASLRGPLAVLTLADDAGTVRRVAWWPDTLPAPDRRALRLLLQSLAHEAAPAAASAQVA